MNSDNYKTLSILDAISRYAPPNENDTENYQNMIANFTGLDISRKIEDLSTEELKSVANAIQRIEGYQPGIEIEFTNEEE